MGNLRAAWGIPEPPAHLPGWQEMIAANESRKAKEWEEAIAVSAPNQHARRTAVAVDTEEDETAKAKRQKVEPRLMPRRPSRPPPPQLLESGHDGHSDPDKADEWM